MNSETEIELEVIKRASESNEEWRKIVATVNGALHDTNPDTGVCKGLVRATYIKKGALDAASLVIIGYVPGKQLRTGISKKIGGFLIANTIELKGFLYIDVVCANYPRLGTKLLEEAQKQAKKSKLSGVALSSLAHVIGYYRKLGFKHSINCDHETNELTQAFNKLAQPFIEKYKGKAPVYIATNDPTASNYRKFLKLLVDLGFAKDEACNTVDLCNANGYIMTRCFIEKTRKIELPPAHTPPRIRSKVIKIEDDEDDAEITDSPTPLKKRIPALRRAPSRETVQASASPVKKSTRVKTQTKKYGDFITY